VWNLECGIWNSMRHWCQGDRTTLLQARCKLHGIGAVRRGSSERRGALSRPCSGCALNALLSLKTGGRPKSKRPAPLAWKPPHLLGIPS
jgi:hypothetical protein